MIGRIKRRIVFELCKLRSNWWLKNAALQAWENGGSLEFVKPPKLDCPIRTDGAGVVRLGADVTLGYRKAPRFGTGEILLQARKEGAEVAIGQGTSTSNNISIVACSRISIGETCQIGDQVAIYDCDFHVINPDTRNDSEGKIQPVSIGHNVWLGSRVIVLKGVSIGNNSVIAAGSIVTKSIPARCLAAGVPAIVVRRI